MYPLIVLVLAGFWGGSFVAIQAIVHEAPPLTAAFWRVVLATVPTIIIAYTRGHRVFDRQLPVRQMCLSGILAMGIPWALLFWAEQHVNGALGAIMNATVPIAVVMLSPLYDPKYKVKPRQWAGVLTAFLGTVVIFWPRLQTGPRSDGLAILALVGMVLCYANAMSYTHRQLKGVPPFIVASWQGIAAALSLAVIGLFAGQPLVTPVLWESRTVWQGIIYLAIFSTAIANLLFVKIIQERGSIAASLITFLIPLVALLLEWRIFGVSPTHTTVYGLVMVLGGLYIVQFPRRRRDRTPITATTEEMPLPEN